MGVFLFAHKLLVAQLITLNATKLNFVVTLYQSTARLTGIPVSKRHRVKRHLKLASPAHAISRKLLMILNDSLDSIG